MDDEQAFRALAANPAWYPKATRAWQVGAGRTADVIVRSGDPLEVNRVRERVLIEGRCIRMTSRSALLQERYREIETRGLVPSYPAVPASVAARSSGFYRGACRDGRDSFSRHRLCVWHRGRILR